VAAWLDTHHSRRAKPLLNVLAARAGGDRSVPAKHAGMARTVLTIDEQDLERELLRKSVDALHADRHRCADCHRTPLTGETVHLYDGRRAPEGARWSPDAGPASELVAVCELCRPLRADAPEHSERVRHSEYGHAVRIHRIRAA
jgi:hypothetical protein